MRTAKEIRRYLKQQHWYKEYVSNLKPIWTRRNMICHIRGYKGDCTISAAFLWDATLQGCDTWRRRDKLFTNWYNRGKKHYEGKKVSSPADGPQSGSRTD